MTPTHTQTRTETGGRGWAYTGALLGAAISIAANIAESCLTPEPPVGSIVAATFWPVSLFISIEIFARTWGKRKWWTALRWAGLVPVALIAGVASYLHMYALLLSYGESPTIAVLGPLAVDGLMVMATGGLIATAPPSRTQTPGSTPDIKPSIEIEAQVTAIEERAQRAEIETEAPRRAALPVSRLTSKHERMAERLEALKEAHRREGKDWRTEKIGYKEIEKYLGLRGDQTKKELYQSLYPPVIVTSQAQ